MEFKRLFDTLLDNTQVMSRTAREGSMNAEGRTGKPVGDISTVELLSVVPQSVAAAAGVILAARRASLPCHDVEALLHPIATFWRKGMLKYRTFPTEKRYGVAPEAIEDALFGIDGFFLGVERRRRDGDPIESAAWIAFQIDDVIHPYADGNGRMAHLLSAWFLFMRCAPLPVFRDRVGYYAAMNAGWDAFLAHYQSCFGGS